MGKYIKFVMISCPHIIQIYIKRAVTARTGILSNFRWFSVLLSHSTLPPMNSVISERTTAEEEEAWTVYKRLLPHYSQEVGCLIFD
jgi:hypothetical protein